MSVRLIQDLHAGISRRDWHAVETAANRLRDDVEKTVAILAGTGVSSLPNDFPLSKLAANAISPSPETNKYAVVRLTDWFVASSLPQADGAFDTYDQAMREATYLNGKLAMERGILDQKMPGTYPFTYRQHYERTFGLPPSPQVREAVEGATGLSHEAHL